MAQHDLLWLETAVAQLRDYDLCRQRSWDAHRRLLRTLEAWIDRQPSPSQALAWLRMQGLAVIGLTVPPEVLQDLVVAPEDSLDALESQKGTS